MVRVPARRRSSGGWESIPVTVPVVEAGGGLVAIAAAVDRAEDLGGHRSAVTRLSWSPASMPASRRPGRWW